MHCLLPSIVIRVKIWEELACGNVTARAWQFHCKLQKWRPASRMERSTRLNVAVVLSIIYINFAPFLEDSAHSGAGRVCVSVCGICRNITNTVRIKMFIWRERQRRRQQHTDEQNMHCIKLFLSGTCSVANSLLSPSILHVGVSSRCPLEKPWANLNCKCINRKLDFQIHPGSGVKSK